MNIYLIGFMGSGKSYTARKLSKSMRLPVVDTDRVIEDDTGMSIAELFAQYGEEYFRELELSAISEAEGIVSCGGGAPTYAPTAEFLSKNLTIFLDTDFDTCYRRIANDPYRPNAKGKTYEELKSLYDSRRPLYLKTAILAAKPADIENLSKNKLFNDKAI
ncbi:MAG: shikimate kinase [Oscillospiraceae bacterium]|jgi:shikimate kinase|nr:shikimate kinase [Oscillospiraceae bacterium]